MNRVAAATLVALLAIGAGTGAQAQDARIITYPEAIQIALENNVDLRQTRNAALLSGVNVQQARNQFLPDLGASAQAGESLGRNFSASEGATINTDAQFANFSVNSGVTLFDGFANTAALKQARLAEKASHLDVQRGRETVVFTVASEYLALIQQQEQLRVQRENLAAQTDLLEQVQTYVDAGARTIADLYQQQANVAGARLALVQAERAAELAKVDLIGALLLDPRGAYEFEPPAAEKIAAAAASDRPALPNLMDQAFAQRADLNAVQQRLSAADQAVRVAKGGYWPTISLSAGYGTSYNSANDTAFSDQLDERRGGSVGVSVSIPIFDRGSVRADTRRAEIAADNARIDLEALHNSVGLQVRRAYLDYRSADEQLSAADAQQKSATLSLEAVTDRYSAGAATLVEVSEARASQVTAASAVVAARYGALFERTLLDYYVGNLDAAKPAGPEK
ncbi:MAG TPA: TolC family protein [Steroidobacteraceae bacterium]|nr:TolC family protein [Steroidobacteraceae bacterium]